MVWTAARSAATVENGQEGPFFRVLHLRVINDLTQVQHSEEKRSQIIRPVGTRQLYIVLHNSTAAAVQVPQRTTQIAYETLVLYSCTPPGMRLDQNVKRRTCVLYTRYGFTGTAVQLYSANSGNQDLL